MHPLCFLTQLTQGLKSPFDKSGLVPKVVDNSINSDFAGWMVEIVTLDSQMVEKSLSGG